MKEDRKKEGKIEKNTSSITFLENLLAVRLITMAENIRDSTL